MLGEDARHQVASPLAPGGSGTMMRIGRLDSLRRRNAGARERTRAQLASRAQSAAASGRLASAALVPPGAAATLACGRINPALQARSLNVCLAPKATKSLRCHELRTSRGWLICDIGLLANVADRVLEYRRGPPRRNRSRTMRPFHWIVVRLSACVAPGYHWLRSRCSIFVLDQSDASKFLRQRQAPGPPSVVTSRGSSDDALGCDVACLPGCFGDEPKRVMMLHSFGLRFKPWTDYAQIIRSEIIRNRKGSGFPRPLAFEHPAE